MTTNREFDRQLADWLHETSAHRVPDHVVDVLLVTRATRQRPWWSSLGRWLPVDVPLRARTFAPNAPWRLMAIAGLVLALIAGVLLFAGSRRVVPPPFGPARNGTLAFTSVGDIYSLDSIDATPRLLVGGVTADEGPMFWRDGTRFGFLRDTHVGGAGMALMEANADGSNVHQVVDLADVPWAGDTSPDGSTTVFAGTRGGVDGVYLAATNGSGAPRRLDLPARDITWLAWRPPTGSELIFVASTGGHAVVSRAASDGTGQRVIKDLGVIDAESIQNFTPAITPDGRSIVYGVADGGFFHNHLLNLETGDDRQLSLGPPGGHEVHAIVSPDGTKVLFHYADPAKPTIQEMLAPIDGSTPAIPIGRAYPIVDGNANLDQVFSPDGRSILIIQGRDREVRLIDAATGGEGRVVSWQPTDLPSWQRLAP